MSGYTPLYNAAGKSYRVYHILLNFGAHVDGHGSVDSMNPLVVPPNGSNMFWVRRYCA